MTTAAKVCRDCGEEVLLVDFYQSAGALSSYCKPCTRARSAEVYRRDPDAAYAKHKVAMRRLRYGIDSEQYEAMVAAQGGTCAICHQAETITTASGRVWDLSVDHDHETGSVRGLLCNRCNALLGHALESVATLEAAVAYLTFHRLADLAQGEPAESQLF
jgi:hypothetical protein